jgi:hypothetical protein
MYSYSEIKVSLWGEHASAFAVDQALAGTEGKPIVMLFVGGLMKRYQGIACLPCSACFELLTCALKG